MNVPYEKIVEGLNFASLKNDLARDRAMDVVASNAKAKLVEEDANGELKIEEVTKEALEKTED